MLPATNSDQLTSKLNYLNKDAEKPPTSVVAQSTVLLFF